MIIHIHMYMFSCSGSPWTHMKLQKGINILGHGAQVITQRLGHDGLRHLETASCNFERLALSAFIYSMYVFLYTYIHIYIYLFIYLLIYKRCCHTVRARTLRVPESQPSYFRPIQCPQDDAEIWTLSIGISISTDIFVRI